MTSLLLILTWSLPLLLAVPAWRRDATWLPVLAVVPALLTLAMVPTGATVEIPWLLLGLSLGLDAESRTLLLGGAIIWSSAALYATGSLRDDPQAGRFRVFFLLAMAGNFLLLLAGDMLAFYLGYALMGLAAYGLVAHTRSTGGRRAGRSYLRWTLVGELLLFCALVVLAEAAGTGFDAVSSSETGTIAMLLLLLAFGIKLAVVGLHLWMPLTYPAAPAAGAAVLSGAMINAGLLGWLRLLPIGAAGYADWGMLLIGLGLVSTFYGVAAGVLQRRAGVVLAYSSMSQMGLLTTGVGIALLVPEHAPLLVPALALFALHHGLCKGGLFLALDLHARNGARRWSGILLVLLALTLIGAPLTGGAVAKSALKAAAPADWQWLAGVFVASGIATTLLMSRFVFLALPAGRRAPRADTLTAAAALLPAVGGLLATYLLAPSGAAVPMLSGLLPLAVGALVAVAVLRGKRLRGLVHHLYLPPGDLPLMFVRRFARTLRTWATTSRHSRMPTLAHPAEPTWLVGAEGRLRAWPLAGGAWLAVCLLLFGLLAL